MKLTATQLSYLKMFGPDTYGMEIPYSIAKTMKGKGLVEWVPPKFGTTLYAITECGKSALSKARLDAVAT